MDTKTRLTSRIATAARDFWAKQHVRLTAWATLALMLAFTLTAGWGAVAWATAPVPERLVVERPVALQIQSDQARFQAWVIDRSRRQGCLSTGCETDDEPRVWLDETDEDYAPVAFRRDLAPALDSLPLDVVATLPPQQEWEGLREQLRSRATKYRAELERQEKEIHDLKRGNTDSDWDCPEGISNCPDPWSDGLPYMGERLGCDFSGCTVAEEVEQAQKWFENRYTFTDIPAWEYAERDGFTPAAIAEFIRRQYDAGVTYAGAYTVPDTTERNVRVTLLGLFTAALGGTTLYVLADYIRRNRKGTWP